jgi:hypothetical protein
VRYTYCPQGTVYTRTLWSIGGPWHMVCRCSSAALLSCAHILLRRRAAVPEGTQRRPGAASGKLERVAGALRRRATCGGAVSQEYAGKRPL